MNSKSLFSILLSTYSVVISGVAPAQEIGKPTFEVDLDTRSRQPATSHNYSSLFQATVRTVLPITVDWRADFAYAHKYDENRFQKALIQYEKGNSTFQGGFVRMPFGIYDQQETYASGIIDYPLARGDYNLNSVDWSAPGVFGSTVMQSFQVEVGATSGRAVGIWNNVNRLNGASARVQRNWGQAILGASEWNGYYDPGYGSPRSVMQVSGVDVRYTLPHLLLRGEYIVGKIGRDYLHGAYLDAYYHLPKFQAWTVTGRLEGFRPTSTAGFAKQATLGVKYVATRNLTAAINWRTNNMSSAYHSIWTPDASRRGEWFAQMYYTKKL